MVKLIASGVAVALILATMAAVAGQIPLSARADDATRPAVSRPDDHAVLYPMPQGRTWSAAPRPVSPEIVAPLAVGLELDEAPVTAWEPVLQAIGTFELAPSSLPNPQIIAVERKIISLAPTVYELRAEMQPAAPPQPEVVAPREPFARQVAKCEPAFGQSAGLKISGALTFTYTDAAGPVPTLSNYTGPPPSSPQVTEPGLELCLTATLSPGVGLFADFTAKAPSDSASLISIDRLYIDLRNILGVTDLRFRIGRDRVTLGPLGLLLDEVVFEDQRDGFALWLPSIGPVRLFGFYQYALLDRSTTRRLWGGRAEAEILPGWTLGVNYRADIAATADEGACPSSDCATGSGFEVDLVGTVVRGLTLTGSYARYTQTNDIPRTYYMAELAFDLKEFGVRLLEPVLTIWYKNFDPYTIPGAGDVAIPRGSFLTPDDFKLFNINDNFTAFGASLELQLASNVAFVAVGEWGTYKGGGPTYNVYSLGLEFSFPENITVKLTYNAYSVAGGSVTTSPVSGIELSNATVYQIELTKSW